MGELVIPIPIPEGQLLQVESGYIVLKTPDAPIEPPDESIPQRKFPALPTEVVNFIETGFREQEFVSIDQFFENQAGQLRTVASSLFDQSIIDMEPHRSNFRQNLGNHLQVACNFPEESAKRFVNRFILECERINLQQSM